MLPFTKPELKARARGEDGDPEVLNVWGANLEIVHWEEFPPAEWPRLGGEDQSQVELRASVGDELSPILSTMHGPPLTKQHREPPVLRIIGAQPEGSYWAIAEVAELIPLTVGEIRRHATGSSCHSHTWIGREGRAGR